MSTKTIYKRIALVAVASLGAGLLSVSPASAADSAGTAAIGPVRVSFIGSSQDAVNAATVTLTADADWTTADIDPATTVSTITVAVTTAPNAAATLTLSALASSPDYETVTTAGAKLGTNGVLTDTDGSVNTVAETLTGFRVKADVAGRYAGTITIDAKHGTSDLLVVPFVINTVGAVASFDFAPTTAGVTSSEASGTISTTVTLRDAANNITQGSTVDTFKLTAAISAGGTVGTFASSGDISAADLTDGTQALVYTNSATAGSTSTLTATPQGTLGSLAAKTLTVTAVAANTAVPTASVAVSNTIVKASTSTSSLNKYTVSTNQATVTFNVTGLTPNTSLTYTVGSSTSNTIAVNGGSAADRSTAGSFTSVSSATGTLAVAVKTTTPAAQTITLDLNGATANATGQVNADFTYAAPAYAVTVTTPAAGSLFATSSAITYTGKVADQFGNVLGGASILATGTPTPATSPSTITATATTAADGTFTVSLAAVAATTTSISTVVSATSAASITDATANVSYFTASGKAATLVLTDTDTAGGVATVDNKSTRVIPFTRVATGAANDGFDDLINADVANTDNQVSITPQTTSPGTIGYTATATNGIRLSTSNMDAALVTGSSITGTGGTAFFAVPTKVGDGVITVVSGGLTQTFTLTGVLPTTPRANLVTLTAGTTAGLYTVTTTDAFGNGVSANVAISVAGPGQFSNGFKNLTVTTTAAGTNTFTVVSAVASATTITASIAGDTNYTATTAAEVTTYGLVAASAAATATLAGIAASTETNTLATLTTLVNSLIAKINALNKLVLKIQKKVRA